MMPKYIKRFLTALLFVCLGGIALFFAPLGPVVAPLAEKELARLVDAQVTLDKPSFSLYRGLRVKRVTIRPEGDGSAPVLLADMAVQHDMRALLAGGYRPRRVQIGSVEAAVTQDILERVSVLLAAAEDSVIFPELEIDDGTIDWPLSDPFRPFQFKRLRVSAGQGDAQIITGTVSFLAGKNDVEFTFDAAPEAGFIETEITATGFDLSFLPALTIAGVDVDPSTVKVRGALSGAVTFLTTSRQWIGDLELTGITAGHPSTGLVIANGRSGVQLDGRDVVFHNADFQVAGGRIAIPAAQLELGEKGVASFRFYGDATRLDLAALKAMGIFSIFPEWVQPGRIDGGVLDAAAEGEWLPAGGMDYRVDLDVREGSGTLKDPDIEASVFEATAAVRTGDKVTVERAFARFWGGWAEVSGAFDILDMDMENYDFDIHFEDIAQNPDLMAVLPEAVAEGVLFAGPSNAKVGGHIRLTDDETGLDLTVGAETLAPPALPMTFSNAKGRIQWFTGSPRIVFEDVSGDIDGSPVRGSGALLLEDRLAADFSVQGKDVPLNRDIPAWLNLELGQWDIDGRFDIFLEARNWRPADGSVADSLAGIQAEMALSAVSSSHPDYGRVAESLEGHLIKDAEGVELNDFKGRVFGIGVDGNGRFPLAAGDDDPYLVINTEMFPLTPDLLRRVPFLSEADGLSAGGRAKIHGRIEARPEDAWGLSGHLTAAMEGAEISNSGMPPLGGSGVVDVRFSGEEASGSISLSDVTAGKFKGEHLSADFHHAPPVLGFRNLHIQAYGGSLDAPSTQINTADKTWSVQFGITEMALESLATSFEVMEKQAFQGRLQSRVILEGRSTDVQSIKGRGEVAVNRGRLYSFPLLVSVLSLFDLKLPTQNPVTDAYGVFSIENGIIGIEDLLFTGGSIPIYLEGYIRLQNDVAFQDQSLFLIVTLARNDSFLDRIPIVGILKHHTLDFLRRTVFQARVTGTVGDYRVTTIRTPVEAQIRKMWRFLQRATPFPGDMDDLF